MRVYLQQLEVMHCVEMAAEEEDFWETPASASSEVRASNDAKKAIRVKQDNKCRSVLIQGVADSHLEYVKDKASPKMIWDSLHDVFERKSITNRFLLKRQLLSMRFIEGEKLQEHFLRFDQLVREIKGAGAKMEEEDVICHLMLTMPQSYDAVTTAMEAVSEKLTMDLVRRKYLDVEAKRKGQRQESETEEAAFTVKYKGRFKCFGCGSFGHKKAQCPKSSEYKSAGSGEASSSQRGKKNVVQKANVGTKTVSFVAAVEIAVAGSAVEAKWFLDSGASEHMAHDRSLFESLHKLKQPVIIQTAKSGVSLFAHHKGRVVTHAIVGDKKIRINMEDVLFIPELSLNLLSLRRLENSGKRVIFFDGRVIVEDGDEVVATGRQLGRLYCMNLVCDKQDGNEKALVTGKVSQSLELWHHRFGHLGNDNLVKLVRKDMVQGMPVGINYINREQFLCESCVSGKQTREPFHPRTEKRAHRPLEIVHSDVCGPVAPVSWDGNQYFVTFTDDFTHVSVVFLLRSKDEVLDRLMEYEAMATSHFGRKIGRLRCDNGGEYTGKAVKKFCKQKGIRVEYTVPYTPEQNGVSERLNRTIVEKVRAMLITSNLPKTMWGEAVFTAVYLLNRSPSVAVEGDITPYEAWNGRKPDVSKLRVFGSECFVHVPKPLRKKLDAKSQKVIFVGYAPNGYRCWNGKKVFVARDIVFNECKFGGLSEEENAKNTDLVVIKDLPSKTHEQADNTKNAQLEPDGAVADESDSDEMHSLPEDEEENTVVNSGARRSQRVVVPPAWHDDYEVDITAFALSAEEFVEDLPSDVEQLKTRSDWPVWKRAIEEELQSLEKNATWSLTELPPGRKVIDNKWVFKIKRHSDGSVDRYKARLVARGFSQRFGFDYTDTYSPVVKMTTLRILLSLANQEGWHVHQMDVKCAFLNGVLDEQVFMRQPSGFERGGSLVCRLNKAIYGLKQASRKWNERFHEFMCRMNFKRSEQDYCLYYCSMDTAVIYVVIYVDDILIIGSSEKAICDLKQKLSSEFEMRDLQEVRSFLGVNIQRDRERGVMVFEQKAYVKSILERFGMTNCKPSVIPMETHLKLEKEKNIKLFTRKPFKELIGCLMYLMVTSRPDICAAVNYFAGFQCCATDTHWIHLKRVLRYLRGTMDYQLVYRRKDLPEKLLAFADADWGNDPNDRRSVSGFVIQFYGSTVAWATKKQSSVALSTTEAELKALCLASCELIWVANLLHSIGCEVKEPLTVYEDNQSCIALTSEPRKQKRMKHVEIQYFFVRELVEQGKLRLQYVPTECQLADVMTKGLASPRFRVLRDLLGLLN